MRKVSILLIFILPNIGICQEGRRPERRISSIGLIFSPGIGNRQLNYSSSNQWIADIRNKEDRASFGFTTGAIIQLRSGRKDFKFQTGLLYSNKGYRTKTKDLTWSSNDPDLPLRSHTLYNFHFVEVPARLTYTFFSKGAVNLYASTRLSLDFFVSKKTKVKTEFPGGSSDSHASFRHLGYSRFSIFGAVGAGANYRISERFSIMIEPYFERSLSSFVSHKGAREYLYAFNFSVGVVKKLKSKIESED